jgi:hypothetical protein
LGDKIKYLLNHKNVDTNTSEKKLLSLCSDYFGKMEGCSEIGRRYYIKRNWEENWGKIRLRK